MGHCLSKNDVKSKTDDDNQPTLPKKQVKEKRKFKRFFRFFFRCSNKVDVAPEDSDPTHPNGNTSSQTTLSEHGSLKSNDEQVNEELTTLTNGNSEDTIPPTNHPVAARRLPPIGNNPSMPGADKSTNEILEELRESGVIANPRPGLSGCSFDIVDTTLPPVEEMPRSLSRLVRGEDDDDLIDGQMRARLQRKLTNAKERRERFLQLRKEALASRKTIEAFQQKVTEEREALDIQSREKQEAAEQRRQDQLLQKPKIINVKEVQKKAEEIDESVREKAQKSMDKKANTAEHVLMKKQHKQRLNTMSNKLHGNAVRRRKQDFEDQIKSDLEREVELDDSYFAPEQQYDL